MAYDGTDSLLGAVEERKQLSIGVLENHRVHVCLRRFVGVVHCEGRASFMIVASQELDVPFH